MYTPAIDQFIRDNFGKLKPDELETEIGLPFDKIEKRALAIGVKVLTFAGKEKWGFNEDQVIVKFLKIKWTAEVLEKLKKKLPNRSVVAMVARRTQLKRKLGLGRKHKKQDIKILHPNANIEPILGFENASHTVQTESEFLGNEVTQADKKLPEMNPVIIDILKEFDSINDSILNIIKSYHFKNEHGEYFVKIEIDKKVNKE